MNPARAEAPRALLHLDVRALEQAKRGSLGRKHPCWCGSGRRYKHCHYETDQAEVRDRPKMSAILDEMVEAVGGMDQCQSHDEAEGLVLFAALVWNATRLDDAACDAALKVLLDRAEDPVETREIVDAMMDVAYLWPDDHRIVAHATVEREPGGGRRIVAMSLGA